MLQAFVKLESLPSIPRERREAYADLAMSIFQQYPPADPHSLTEAREYPSAGTERKSKHTHGSTDDAGTDKDQVWRLVEHTNICLHTRANDVAWWVLDGCLVGLRAA